MQGMLNETDPVFQYSRILLCLTCSELLLSCFAVYSINDHFVHSLLIVQITLQKITSNVAFFAVCSSALARSGANALVIYHECLQ